MAEIWPRLKEKFAGDARRRRKSSKGKKANSCASSGLEKIAALLHAKKSSNSLVERTGASVCAARSLSRSAQEWTAVSTLARTVFESQEGSKSPEIVLLNCAVRPSEAQTRSSEYTECFAFAETRVSNSESIEVEKSCPESENVCESESPSVRKLHRDLGNLSEERQSLGNKEQTSRSRTLCVALPVKTSRCMMKTRRSGWRQTSSSAFVVLVALGAFISSRFGKVGNPLAAVLTFNTVIGIWRRGKLYASFMFSSVALYFLTPLKSYLTYCPRRLSSLPRKLKVITDAQSHHEASRKLKAEIPNEERSSSLEISVLPLEFAPSAVGAPLSLLVTIPESSTAPASDASIESVPATVMYKKSGASSPSRRLAKKLASRFKKLKMFRSSSSQSSVSLLSVSESSLSSGAHFTASSEPDKPISPSSPDKHRKCPFSRPHKSKSDMISSEVAEVHGGEDTVHTTDKVASGKKSRLGKKLSTEILEQQNIGEISACTNDPTSTTSRSAEATDASRNVSWPGVGLLVTLLFLLVGRLPAIMATSLFILVVSNAHHDRAHPRGRGSETQALNAARKLHRSPPPRRSSHPGSPPRRH